MFSHSFLNIGGANLNIPCHARSGIGVIGKFDIVLIYRSYEFLPPFVQVCPSVRSFCFRRSAYIYISGTIGATTVGKKTILQRIAWEASVSILKLILFAQFSDPIRADVVIFDRE